MNIAITGTNGFIAKHLTESLKAKNINVIKIKREKNHFGHSESKFLLTSNGKDYLKNVDIVIHCAARVHRLNERGEEVKKLYKESNVDNTKILAKHSIKSGVKKFIFLSSIKVNGEETKYNQFFNENSKVNPLDNYAKSKYEAEKELFLLKKDLKVVIIRPPLVYGPRVGANFRKIISAVNQELPLPFKNIKNKRSFIYIKNLNAFIYECCINKNADNKIFTVSDNYDISTNELIEKLNFYLNKNSLNFYLNENLLKLFFRIIRKEETFKKLFGSLQIDPSKSFEELKFIPPFTLDEGLKETANWYKSQYTKNN